MMKDKLLSSEEVTMYICLSCGCRLLQEDIENYNMKYCPICRQPIDPQTDLRYDPPRKYVVRPRPLKPRVAYLKYLVGRFGRLESEIQEREDEKSRILEQLFVHAFPGIDFYSGRYSKHKKDYEE